MPVPQCACVLEWVIDNRRSPVTAVAIGGSVAVVSGLPLFLAGAMGVQLTHELGFGAFGLGLAVATFRGVGAVLSIHLGRLADHLGATRSVRLAATLAALGALGIATTARGLGSLLAWLAVSGCALALAQPASNRLLIRIVDHRRLGLAFGIKQSAAPTGSMLAGLSVPVVGLTVGWRWAYVMVAILATVVLLAAGKAPVRDPVTTKPRAVATRLKHRGLIVLVGFAFALADATSVVTTTFYVSAAVQAGTAQAFAGTILAVASVAAVTTRVLGGLVSDRLAAGHLTLCAVLLAAGSTGLALLATGRAGLMSLGAVIALAGTWGFNGVFWFAMVRTYYDTPGRITGALAPGGLLGNTAGPVLFGFIVETAGYEPAWVAFGIVGLAAAAAMHMGSRCLMRLGTADP